MKKSSRIRGCFKLTQQRGRQATRGVGVWGYTPVHICFWGSAVPARRQQKAGNAPHIMTRLAPPHSVLNVHTHHGQACPPLPPPCHSGLNVHKQGRQPQTCLVAFRELGMRQGQGVEDHRCHWASRLKKSVGVLPGSCDGMQTGWEQGSWKLTAANLDWRIKGSFWTGTPKLRSESRQRLGVVDGWLCNSFL